MNVHPVADLFPMLPEDELRELAADIAERGLLQPIVLDGEGRVLDGRNRLAACKIAGVEPTFTTYDGDDPDGYALAVNIARRHLTASQRGMITARAARFTSESLRTISESSGVAFRYLSHANVVLDHAPDLADLVMSGAQSLDAAYEEARKRKANAKSDEQKMALLRANAPDLADQVTEERLTLAEAIAAMQERDRQRAEKRRDARSLLVRIVDLAAPESASDGFVTSWAEHLGEPDDELAALTKRAEQAANVLLDLVERIKQ